MSYTPSILVLTLSDASDTLANFNRSTSFPTFKFITSLYSLIVGFLIEHYLQIIIEKKIKKWYNLYTWG